jgi:hypothetical protein
MGDFVDSPMTGDWFQKNGNVPDGSAGKYDEDYCPIFNTFRRTKGPNSQPEKFYEKSMPNPGGEPDQF